MKLIEAFRTATFRTAVVGSLFFAAATLLLYGFIYWQTAGYERASIDTYLANESRVLLREAPADAVRDVRTRFTGDLHRLTFAAIFDPARHLLGGDIIAYPPGLEADGVVARLAVVRPSPAGPEREIARVLARTLPGGGVLVVGRSDADLAKLRRVLTRGFALGLAPGILLALAAGTLASLRMLAKVAALNQAIDRIMAGAIHARLPVHDTRDAVDRLSNRVNTMLDRIEALIREVQGVGDDIAHDLRTPLSRARSRLEGGRLRARSREELAEVVDRSIADLDQTFATITSLLRIRQIETSQRRTNFAPVDLTAIAREAQDLYQPLAELRGQSLDLVAAPEALAFGDRDLLFEALANLLDNAVKFAPQGGMVRLSVLADPQGGIIRVEDDGPGIPEQKRDAVIRRFYRSDPSRHAAGTGLGLSLVAAILGLHGFRLRMHDEAGRFTVEMDCRQQSPP